MRQDKGTMPSFMQQDPLATTLPSKPEAGKQLACHTAGSTSRLPSHTVEHQNEAQAGYTEKAKGSKSPLPDHLAVLESGTEAQRPGSCSEDPLPAAPRSRSMKPEPPQPGTWRKAERAQIINKTFLPESAVENDHQERRCGQRRGQGETLTSQTSRRSILQRFAHTPEEMVEGYDVRPGYSTSRQEEKQKQKKPGRQEFPLMLRRETQWSGRNTSPPQQPLMLKRAARWSGRNSSQPQ